MKKLAATIVIAILTLILVSCRWNPPSPEDTESFIEDNWNEITLINEYLLGLEDRDAYISDDSGSVFIDLNWQIIENEKVKAAVQKLWKSGCTGISKYNENNAITYTIWRRTFGQVGCGFVYQIEETVLPDVQYETELVPLSRERWYYYLAEYEKWRTDNT